MITVPPRYGRRHPIVRIAEQWQLSNGIPCSQSRLSFGMRFPTFSTAVLDLELGELLC